MTFWKLFLGYVVITVLSALTFQTSLIHAPLFWLITAATFGLALHRLDWGVYIIAAELFIGSKGHLFWFTIAYDVEWGRIGIRIGIFAAVMLAWVIDRIRKKRWPTLVMDHSLTYVLPFILIIGYALFRGLMNDEYGFGRVIADANNWMFVLIVFPVIDAVKEFPQFFVEIKQLAKSAIAFLITKATFFFVVFAAAVPGLMEYLYHFERQTGGGQLAPATDGMWRIYFWSELFLIPALVIVVGVVYHHYKTEKWTGLWTGALVAVVYGITLTLFRSFWAGAIIAVVTWVVLVVAARKYISLRIKPFLGVIGVLFAGVFIAIGAIQFVGQGLAAWSGGLPEVQKELFSSGEPGIQNRLNQISPMVEQIADAPILGSGFGTAVTYESIDPRHLGSLTTTALELGWLDMMMEMGIVGVILFMVWLVYIAGKLWKTLSISPNQVYWSLGLLAGGVGIVAVHAFSPFLNHPLGISFVVFSFAYALRYSDHFSGTH